MTEFEDVKHLLERVESHAHIVKGSEVWETIIHALRIADKLMQEPSREMVQHTKTGWHHSTVFTVMRDQMLKEIDNEEL